MTFGARLLLLLLTHMEGHLCRIRAQEPYLERELSRVRGRHLRSLMGASGDNLRIGEGVRFLNPAQVFLGQNVYIGPGSRVDVIISAPDQNPTPRMEFGNNVSLEANCHVACARRVWIEDDVMIASGVYISDHDHVYQDIRIPVKKQSIVSPADVSIGKGSFVGEAACILAGSSVGEHCVVGARAVVTASIPSFTVAVEIPARPVRRFNQSSGRWEEV